MKPFFLLLAFTAFGSFSQSEAVEKTDCYTKDGYWITYGYMKPYKGYPDSGMIEQGMYKDDRKEGCWVFYYSDGITPKLEGHFKNGRPNGTYTKYWPNGSIKEEGEFTLGKQTIVLGSYSEKGDSLNFQQDDGLEYGMINGLYPEKGDVSVSDCSGIFYICDSTVEYSFSKLLRYDPEIHHVKSQTGFDENGQNVVYNIEDEAILDGNFSYGAFWEGKHYVYDEDGILLKIEIWKEGKYCCDGQL